MLQFWLKFDVFSDEYLKNYTEITQNPFGDNVYFQSYRYTGVYEVYLSNTNNTEDAPSNPNTESLDENNETDVETLQK